MTIVVRSKEKKLEYYAVNAEVIGIAGGLTQISEERAYKIMKGEGYTLQIETSEKVPILNIVGIAKGTIQISTVWDGKDRLWCILKEDKKAKSITMSITNARYGGTSETMHNELMQIMALEFIAVKEDAFTYQFGYSPDSRGSFRKLTAIAIRRQSNGESTARKQWENYKDECGNYGGKRLIKKLCNDLLNGSVLILRNTNIPYGYWRIGAEEVSRRMMAEAIKCGYTN